MKQYLKLLSAIFIFFTQTAAFCAEAKDLGRRVFVVETDPQSAAESLDRISGKIDLGFSAPEQTFSSSDHYAPGPFARQQQVDQTK